MTTTSTERGQQLANHIYALGFSNKECAELFGISDRYWIFLRKGERTASDQLLARMEQFLAEHTASTPGENGSIQSSSSEPEPTPASAEPDIDSAYELARAFMQEYQPDAHPYCYYHPGEVPVADTILVIQNKAWPLCPECEEKVVSQMSEEDDSVFFAVDELLDEPWNEDEEEEEEEEPRPAPIMDVSSAPAARPRNLPGFIQAHWMFFVCLLVMALVFYVTCQDSIRTAQTSQSPEQPNPPHSFGEEL